VASLGWACQRTSTASDARTPTGARSYPEADGAVSTHRLPATPIAMRIRSSGWVPVCGGL